MIYFDNSATTKPYAEVIDSYIKVAENFFGNPSSIHTLGSEAEKLLTQSRKLTAAMLNVNPSEIYFTSGGSEGNNLAIKGTSLEYQSRGKHMITTSVEHPSVLEAFKQLEYLGFDITYLPVDKAGRVNIETLKSAIRKDTILVSIIHVNNEMGTIQPIAEIGKLLKDYPKILFHVDNVQGIGKVPLNISASGIDLCTFSGHKFHAMKGTGFIYIRDGVKLSAILSGGGQESGIRAGTENIAGIVSMTKALRMTLDKMATEIANLQVLKEMLITGLSKIDGIVINTPKEESAPHIVNFSIPKLKPEVLIQSLSKENIYVSTKSACSSKLAQASRILLEAGLGEEIAKSAIRVSFTFSNTAEEVNEFLNVLSQKLSKLQEVMR
ncbi:cysteine desulfurase family protein [Bacillus sp. Marseille-P3661]|uniref:cysteine desulfurase family protein n=1 Tax=Bacillus sp. Marseille-P3661 TaxID=1936234 RepID=UPI000C867879|nr:cysteine desulfurase family protein [Bacillus sp. Marseille-P3661]